MAQKLPADEEPPEIFRSFTEVSELVPKKPGLRQALPSRFKLKAFKSAFNLSYFRAAILRMPDTPPFIQEKKKDTNDCTFNMIL